MKTKLQSIIERFVSYAIAIIAVIVMIHYFGTENKRQEAEKEKKTRDILEFDRKILEYKEELTRRENQCADITKDIKVKEAEIREKFDDRLRPSDSYIDFIEQVQRKAKALDILIQNSTYDLPAKSDIYLECKFSATVSGQYNKIKRFLWEVENAMGWFVKVSNIEIIPPICDKQGNMTIKLTLITFLKSNQK